MKNIYKILSVVLILAVTAAFAGCSSSSEEANKFVDSWFDKVNQKTIVKIGEEENGKYKVEIAQATSNTSEVLWTMTCEYNEDSACMEYSDGVKINHSYDADGKEIKEEEYTDGKGNFRLEEKGWMIWTDEKDDAGAECVFFRFDDIAKDLNQ